MKITVAFSLVLALVAVDLLAQTRVDGERGVSWRLEHPPASPYFHETGKGLARLDFVGPYSSQIVAVIDIARFLDESRIGAQVREEYEDALKALRGQNQSYVDKFEAIEKVLGDRKSHMLLDEFEACAEQFNRIVSGRRYIQDAKVADLEEWFEGRRILLRDQLKDLVSLTAAVTGVNLVVPKDNAFWYHWSIDITDEMIHTADREFVEPTSVATRESDDPRLLDQGIFLDREDLSKAMEIINDEDEIQDENIDGKCIGTPVEESGS